LTILYYYDEHTVSRLNTLSLNVNDLAPSNAWLQDRERRPACWQRAASTISGPTVHKDQMAGSAQRNAAWPSRGGWDGYYIRMQQVDLLRGEYQHPAAHCCQKTFDSEGRTPLFHLICLKIPGANLSQSHIYSLLWFSYVKVPVSDRIRLGDFSYFFPSVWKRGGRTGRKPMLKQ